MTFRPPDIVLQVMMNSSTTAHATAGNNYRTVLDLIDRH
jgi:hypothetical protein